MNDLFKTQIINDLANVFLNPNEFAEPHNVNGVPEVICVIDSDSTQALHPGLGRFDGTEKETIMLFIDVVNWPGNPPDYNQLITIDQVRYRVKNSNPFNGLYEISLEAIK